MEITFDGGKVITANFKDHVVRTDQSVKNGGGNTAPAPFDLFLASIGTCAGIYVKSFCDQRQIPADKIKIIQEVEFNMEKRIPAAIKLDIQLPPDFPEKYRDVVKRVVDQCAVKRHIMNPPAFEINVRE